MSRWLWRTPWVRQVLDTHFIWVLFACCLLYLGVYAAVVGHAYAFLGRAQTSVPNPVVVVLGNKAHTKGVPNPCMTGRVDKGLEILRQNAGGILLVSGGMDPVEQRFESQVMAEHALALGFTGLVIQEQRATTTYENLKYSTQLLQAIGAKTVVIVSEPYHLWRVSLMAHGQGMDKQFELHFVAAETRCWNNHGVFFSGVLQEPLALVKNFLQRRY